jgi:hypothetical protein
VTYTREPAERDKARGIIEDWQFAPCEAGAATREVYFELPGDALAAIAGDRKGVVAVALTPAHAEAMRATKESITVSVFPAGSVVLRDGSN